MVHYIDVLDTYKNIDIVSYSPGVSTYLFVFIQQNKFTRNASFTLHLLKHKCTVCMSIFQGSVSVSRAVSHLAMQVCGTFTKGFIYLTSVSMLAFLSFT